MVYFLVIFYTPYSFYYFPSLLTFSLARLSPSRFIRKAIGEIMKALFLKLLIASWSLWAISCGQMDLVSTDIIGGSSSVAKVEQMEAEAEAVIQNQKTLNRNLGKSYSKVVATVSKASNPITLAKLILSEETDIEKLFEWADELLDNIEKVRSPLVNDRVEAIRDLRDAEADLELRSRYDAILNRMQEEHTTTEVNIDSLRRKAQSGIRATRKAQDWMVDGNIGVTFFFLTFGSDIYGKVVDLEIALNYLDVNLSKMEE